MLLPEIPSPMVAFPNAKINIGLHIIEKRADGYHNLESCFYPVKWEDVLEVIKAPETKFTASGLSIPGDPADNLCLRAYRMLQKDFDLSPVHIHLHKAIPVGAGLGGGSSDAAHTLKLLDALFNLQLDVPLLEKYALRLGSDCPFFIRNVPVLAYQRGEVFKAARLDLGGKFIVLVNPDICVSTAEAYQGVKPAPAAVDLEAVLAEGPAGWKGRLVNSFEESLFIKYPAIEDIKNTLYASGAQFASMTGSGATVFGLFETETAIEHLFPENYLLWQGRL